MKTIILKISKFISSRLVYLMIGIFLAVSFTYVYATWDTAKTGGAGSLGQSNWNALITEIHNKCGNNCDAKATAATAVGDTLTENNWNNLADLLSSTLVDCTADNGGKCFVNQASKSSLDTDLVAGNIKSGTTIFGVTGSYSASSPPDGWSGNCVWKSGDESCPSGYPNKHTRVVYSGCYCTGGGAQLQEYSSGSYLLSQSCSGQGCVTNPDYSNVNNFRAYNVAGSCNNTGATTYTYCCQ
ncbi:MAG: hypothetical protein WC582_01880 [Patescibacteria group bacterium]